MFCFGIIGFLAGVLVKTGFLKKNRLQLCIFGGVTTFFIYGGIMNFASLLMFNYKITTKSLMATYMSGIPFDMIHVVATIFFLFIISKPMIEKLDRIKIKYGLIQC